MKVKVIAGILLWLALSIAMVAQNAQELYQRGLVEEHSNGNLDEAIKLYFQVAKAVGNNRALAAKALIRIGSSQEKLGNLAEATDAYTEVVRVYPEQRGEASIAQNRLNQLRRTPRASSPQSEVPESKAAERVTDLEWAVRIAAFLWGTAPDASLLADARNGRLHDPVTLNRQVVRMLRDPKSANFVSNFMEPWLSLDQVSKASVDTAAFPQADPELLQAMQTEVRLFLESQLREDRGVMELWTANYTFVNDRLARHYGMTGISGKTFRRVTWYDANRAGILGMAGTLTATSFPSRTSPTKRGIYVLTKFLGMSTPSPPANVPPMSETAAAREISMRDRLALHKLNPSCANCHATFDPPGLALENFDGIGQWRSEEGGAPIDASGAFVDGTRFNGPVELRAALLKYSDAHYTNVTQRLLAYALNRKGSAARLYDYEIPSVQTIVRTAGANEYRWSAFISGVIASKPFWMKNLVP